MRSKTNFHTPTLKNIFKIHKEKELERVEKTLQVVFSEIKSIYEVDLRKDQSFLLKNIETILKHTTKITVMKRV